MYVAGITEIYLWELATILQLIIGFSVKFTVD